MSTQQGIVADTTAQIDQFEAEGAAQRLADVDEAKRMLDDYLPKVEQLEHLIGTCVAAVGEPKGLDAAKHPGARRMRAQASAIMESIRSGAGLMKARHDRARAALYAFGAEVQKRRDALAQLQLELQARDAQQLEHFTALMVRAGFKPEKRAK